MDGVQIVQVFFGADQARGARGFRFMQDFFVVCIREAVMVGRKFVAGDFESPGAKVGDEGLRIADGAEGEQRA